MGDDMVKGYTYSDYKNWPEDERWELIDGQAWSMSPATAMKDQTEKRLFYEAHGVREYWIINPETFELFIYTLQEGTYPLPAVADLRQPVPVRIFEGLSLSVRPEDL
jgi:hypothetical protein